MADFARLASLPSLSTPAPVSPFPAAVSRASDAASALPSKSGLPEAVSLPQRFSDVLSDAVARVENYRVEAESAVDRFLAGEGGELHEVAIATQRAEVSLELFLEVKNKVVQAYQEVMRMQV